MYFVFIYVSKSDLSMLMIYLSMSKKDFFFFLQFDGTDSDQKKGTKRELGFSGKTKTTNGHELIITRAEYVQLFVIGSEMEQK